MNLEAGPINFKVKYYVEKNSRNRNAQLCETNVKVKVFRQFGQKVKRKKIQWNPKINLLNYISSIERISAKILEKHTNIHINKTERNEEKKKPMLT